MIDIIEGALIAGALALDVYAYKKMKDAEELADAQTPTRVDARTTILTGTTSQTPQAEATPSPVAAGAASGSSTTTMTSEDVEEHDWKQPPITYAHADESADGQASEEFRLYREQLKSDMGGFGERIDVIEERIRDYQTRTEERLDTIENRVEKGATVPVDEDKIATTISVKLSDKTDRLGKKIDAQSKKLQELEAKVDSALISQPDSTLLKKDMREEFASLLGLGKKMDENHQKTTASIATLSKKVATNRRVLEEQISALKKRRVTATAARKVTTAIGTKTGTRKTVAKPKTTRKTATVKKTTTTSKTVKSVRKTSKPKTAKSSKAPASKAEVTVTTKVPKGVDVSTEVVTGKNA